MTKNNNNKTYVQKEKKLLMAYDLHSNFKKKTLSISTNKNIGNTTKQSENYMLITYVT